MTKSGFRKRGWNEEGGEERSPPGGGEDQTPEWMRLMDKRLVWMEIGMMIGFVVGVLVTLMFLRH